MDCIGTYYVYNDQIKECTDFSDDLILSEMPVYDVMRLYKGKPLFFDEHYKRLLNTGEQVNLNIWISRDELLESVAKLVDTNKVTEGNVKVVISRAAPRFYTVYLNDYVYPNDEAYDEGVFCSFLQEERVNPTAKLYNKELREKTVVQKKEAHVFELILVDQSGYITEGSRTNLFFVQGDKLITALPFQVLPGINAAIVKKVCEENGITITEQLIPVYMVERFDAAFLTSTSNQVLPVSYFDWIRMDTTNSLLRKVMGLYELYCKKYMQRY